MPQYEYRKKISWWVFAVAAVGALGVTLLTVGFSGDEGGVGESGEVVEIGVRGKEKIDFLCRGLVAVIRLVFPKLARLFEAPP